MFWTPSRNKYELKNLTLERLHCDINIDEENQGEDKQLDMFHDNRAHMMELGLKTGAAVYALMEIEQRELEEQGLKKVFEEAELPLIEVLASMEAEGVKSQRRLYRRLRRRIKRKAPPPGKMTYIPEPEKSLI